MRVCVCVMRPVAPPLSKPNSTSFSAQGAARTKEKHAHFPASQAHTYICSGARANKQQKKSARVLMKQNRRGGRERV